MPVLPLSIFMAKFPLMSSVYKEIEERIKDEALIKLKKNFFKPLLDRKSEGQGR